MKQLSCATALFVAGLAGSTAHAAASAEQKCQAARVKAAGAYALCQQQALAKWLTTFFDSGVFEAATSKCRVKYTRTWAELQKKGALSGSSCIGARFTDSGTTVILSRTT